MLGDIPGAKGRIFGFDQFPAVCVEEIDALQQRHRVRLDLYDIPQLHAGEYHQVLADMQVISPTICTRALCRIPRFGRMVPAIEFSTAITP